MPHLSAVFATALVALVAFACAGGPSTQPAPYDSAGTLLVLPFNVPTSRPEHLEELGPIVWREIALYLESPERHLLPTPEYSDARARWVESTRAARQASGSQEFGLADAGGRLASAIARERAFDLLIIPSLFERQAKISGRYAKWDDASRRIEFVAKGLAARRLAGSTPYAGSVPALSLHVAVFDAQGVLVYEKVGGLTLLAVVEVIASGNDSDAEDRIELVDRLEIDRTQVREGIGEIFAPALSRGTTPSR